MKATLARIVMFSMLAGLSLAMGGCGSQESNGEGGETERKLLQSPAVGDLYAAELTYFSEASFEDQPSAYGLMKVIAVDADEVTVITENAASDNKTVPSRDIRGDLANIEFDDSERIVIARGELVRAQEAGKIFAVRR
ncbi:MAG TPA: hypothetical protein VLF15_03175 [Pseudoxanthomonas sp.]|nr:hypothetical protein [Pseudoxanthomonas sp.]